MIQKEIYIKNTGAYSEPSQTCKMDLFAKLVNGIQPLTVLS